MAIKVYLVNGDEEFERARPPMPRAAMTGSLSKLASAGDVAAESAAASWLWLCVLDRWDQDDGSLADDVAEFANELCFDAPECFADRSASQNIAVCDSSTPADVIDALLESDRCGLVFDETGAHGEPFIEMEDIREGDQADRGIEYIAGLPSVPEDLATKSALRSFARGLGKKAPMRFQYAGEVDDDTAWSYAASAWAVVKDSVAGTLYPVLKKVFERCEFEGISGEPSRIDEDYDVAMRALVEAIADDDDRHVLALLDRMENPRRTRYFRSLSPKCLAGHPEAESLFSFCLRFVGYIGIWASYLQGCFGDDGWDGQKCTAAEMAEEGGLDIAADSLRAGVPISALFSVEPR